MTFFCVSPPIATLPGGLKTPARGVLARHVAQTGVARDAQVPFLGVPLLTTLIRIPRVQESLTGLACRVDVAG